MIKNKLISLALGCTAFVLAAIFTFAAGEVVTRLYYSFRKNYDIEMWRYAAQGKVKSRLPGLSHEHRKGAYFKDLYGTEVKINSKGLRDYEYDYLKPKHCYRVLVLGDSITFGWGVDFSQTYPKLLEKKLNERSPGQKFEVINSGVGNYNLRDELSYLEYEGLKYSPDLIILGFFLNDAERHDKQPPNFLARHSCFYTFLWSHWNAFVLRMNFNKGYRKYYSELYKDGSSAREEFDSAAQELIEISNKNNIPVLVLMIPDLHSIRDYPFDQVNAHIKKIFLKAANIRVVEALPYFDSALDPLDYWVSKEDPHPNARGHKALADCLYDTLIKIL